MRITRRQSASVEVSGRGTSRSGSFAVALVIMAFRLQIIIRMMMKIIIKRRQRRSSSEINLNAKIFSDFLFFFLYIR